MIDPTPPIAGTPAPADMNLYRDQLQKPEGVLRAELSKKFDGKEFVLVRGFLTDTLDRIGIMMQDQKQAIENLGRPVRKVGEPFDSENTPDVNATAIVAMVKSAALPVILVTHSKGSVDTLTMLINNPSVREKIAGWVSIQGAVQGSTVADFLVGTGTTPAIIEAAKRAVLSVVFEHLFKGSLGALDSLRTSDRVEYLRRNAAEIDKIVARISIVAYGSAAPMSRSALRTLTDPFFKGEPHNDGLVSVERTVIPGARIIHDLDGPDHGDAVIDVPGPQDWDRIRLTYALLSLLERY